MARNAKNIEHKVLSDRGVFLERAHQRQQSSNINAGMEVVVGEDVRVKIGQRCPVCNKRVRGPNHVNGTHHKGTVARQKSKR